MKRFTLIGAIATLPIAFGWAIAEQPKQAITQGNSEILTTRSSLESLTEASTIPLVAGRTLTLEPGIRMTRTDAGYLFSAYTGRRIEFDCSRGPMFLPSPALLQLTADGWLLDGRALDGHSLTARRAQDDADTNLKSMQEAAKKLKAKQEPTANSPQANRKLRVRWLFSEDPMPTAELFNTAAIQQLTHVSNIGF